MDNIIPNSDDIDNGPTTSLEKAHSMAVHNLEQADHLLAQATQDGAPAERLEQLRHLREVAKEDLERTRRNL